MAELHVQKKETNIWPWIIGAVVLALLAWWAFGRNDMHRTVTTSSADSTYSMPGMGAPGNRNPGTP